MIKQKKHGSLIVQRLSKQIQSEVLATMKNEYGIAN